MIIVSFRCYETKTKVRREREAIIVGESQKILRMFFDIPSWGYVMMRGTETIYL